MFVLTFARGSATTVFVVVGEGDAFDQTFGAQKFGRWLWILQAKSYAPALFDYRLRKNTQAKSQMLDWQGLVLAAPRAPAQRPRAYPNKVLKPAPAGAQKEMKI